MWIGSNVLLIAVVFSYYDHLGEAAFNIYDDVLAYPEFDIVFPDSYVSEAWAARKLGRPVAVGDAVASAPKTDYEQQPLLERHHLGDDHHHHGDKQQEETSEEERKESSEAEDASEDIIEDGDEQKHEAEMDYEHMLLGEKSYLCALPRVRSGIGEEEKNGSSTEAEHETDLVMAAERGWELLQDLEGKCMFFMSGWWTYSFCYNSQVKQFHRLPPGRGVSMYPPQEDPAMSSYVLGQFDDGGVDVQRGRDDGSTSAELQVKGDTRYLVQKLGGGTICDLTGRERRVEIQFHCHPQSTPQIRWIKEVATCRYLMVIWHPRLCNDVAFLPPRHQQAHTISCQEILGSAQVVEWQRHKSRQAEQHLTHQPKRTPLMAGDVEIGAMKEVGTEGRRIQKGRVVSPPEVEIEIIAQKVGGKLKRLSKEDLKKINLDPKAVEHVGKEIQTAFGDKDWRLERMVDSRGSVLLRAVLEEDDEESQEGQEEKEQGSEEKAKDEAKEEPEADINEEERSERKDGEGDSGVVEGSEEVYKDGL